MHLKFFLTMIPLGFGTAIASALYGAQETIVLTGDSLIPIGLAVIIALTAIGSVLKVVRIFDKLIHRIDSLEKAVRTNRRLIRGEPPADLLLDELGLKPEDPPL